MGYRQPGVPEYRESEDTSGYIRLLVRFLKDFSLSAWTANKRRIGEIEALERRISLLEGREDAAGKGDA